MPITCPPILFHTICMDFILELPGEFSSRLFLESASREMDHDLDATVFPNRIIVCGNVCGSRSSRFKTMVRQRDNQRAEIPLKAGFLNSWCYSDLGMRLMAGRRVREMVGGF